MQLNPGEHLWEVAVIKIGLEDADFWIVRRGTRDAVGSVTQTYGPQHIGIRVWRTDQLVPKFVYYSMMRLHQLGYWRTRTYGTTNLVNIRVADVKEIPLTRLFGR